MDFTDLASRYLQTRMDTATRPFTDPQGYMSQRLGLPTTADMEANVQPKSTTITYNPDGTQTVTEKKEVTPAAQPRFNFGAQPGQPQQYMNLADSSSQQPVDYQPVAPTAPAPVQTAPQPAPVQTAPQPMAPDQTYNRMIQAESGGQQYNPQGGVLTSPKGAMGVGQVMPSTAMQPGYGVPSIFDMAQQRGMPVPARDQATAQQLLGNPELNRDFGQTYYNAMQQRFPGQPAAAVAAYNAGPGRVGQNMQANAGQLNVAQLPQETQGYLQKVGFQPGQTTPAVVGTNAPSTTVPPVTGDAVAQGTYQDVTGNQVTEAARNEYYGKQVVNNLNNPIELQRLSEDANAPEFAKVAASRQAFELLKTRRDEQAAKRTVDSGDQAAIEKAFNRRNDEGSYIKAYLFQRLGLNDLAQSEQAKLGAGRVWEQNTLDTGEVALIQRASNGMPLFGIDQTGRELTAKELIRFGGAPIKGVEQGKVVYKDPFYRSEVKDAQGNIIQTAQGVAGNWILETRPGSNPVYREVGSRRLASPEEARRLNPTGVSGPIEQQAAAAYASRGAGKQGEQAAEGFTNTPLADRPTGTATGGTTTGGAAIATTPVSTAGAPAPAANIPSASPTLPVYEQKKASAIAEKRTESFNKIIDTEYRDNGARGEIVSTNRKLQFDILNRDDPATGKKVGELISGLQTAANEDPSNQKWSIVRDLFAGKVATNPDGTPMNGQQLSDRMTQLNISPMVKSALTEYNALNAQIAGQTLRETAGPGSVSDAEQQANRARNVEITKTPMLGAYNMMAQSQFNADIQRYKSDLAAGPNNTATSATAFDRDFRRHQAELIKSYREVTEARLKFIQENGMGPGAIREGYKRYPVPEYDASSGNWKYLKPLDQIIKKKEGQSL